MNGYYNRPLTLTDFLYLSVFFIGMCKVNQINSALLFLPYIAISFSILLDWNSAITIANGGIKLLISDIVTSLNYLFLYMTFEHIRLNSANTMIRFFAHYSLVFAIYFVWNILVIVAGKTTKKTKIFFGIYCFLAIVCFFICIASSIYIVISKENVRVESCKYGIIIIALFHIFILFTWLIFTYFINTKESRE